MKVPKSQDNNPKRTDGSTVEFLRSKYIDMFCSEILKTYAHRQSNLFHKEDDRILSLYAKLEETYPRRLADVFIVIGFFFSFQFTFLCDFGLVYHKTHIM